MRIGFHIGPFFVSSSTHSRRKSNATIRDFFYVLFSPFILIFKIIEAVDRNKRKKEAKAKHLIREEEWRKQKAIIDALSTPYVSELAGVKDDRNKPPREKGEMEQGEFDQLWEKWIYSQNALKELQSNSGEALPMLKKAQDDFPFSLFLQYAEAVALYKIDKKKESYEILKKLPDQKKLIDMKVIGAIFSKDFQGAVDTIQRLPLEKQLETHVIFQHATCLIELKKYNAALEVLTNFNYHKPANKGKVSSFWHYLRGRCYKELGNKGKAITELEKTQAYPLPDVDVQKEIDELRSNVK